MIENILLHFSSILFLSAFALLSQTFFAILLSLLCLNRQPRPPARQMHYAIDAFEYTVTCVIIEHAARTFLFNTMKRIRLIPGAFLNKQEMAHFVVTFLVHCSLVTFTMLVVKMNLILSLSRSLAICVLLGSFLLNFFLILRIYYTFPSP